MKIGSILLAMTIFVSAVFTAVAQSAVKNQNDGNLSLSEPTLEQKIGQMILVGFVGTHENYPWFKQVKRQVATGKVTGILYLKRNAGSRENILKINSSILGAGARHAPLIAVDQEGGKIERLTPRNGFPHTPSAQQISSKLSVREAYEAYLQMAENLDAWGFNLNLGPVVDLNINKSNPIIGRLGRSYSDDPAIVAQYAAAFVDAHRKFNILTALKHFPGHGSSLRDSHRGAVDVSKTWRSVEQQPYEELIASKHADIIMSAHVRNMQLQANNERVPVSLSKTGLSDVLRGQLNYSGVIMSDDLQMDAIKQHHSLRDAVIKAVNAGNDILIFANDKNPDINIPAKVTGHLLREANRSEAFKAAIDRSYKRIVQLKSGLNPSLTKIDGTKTESISMAANASRPTLTPELVLSAHRDFPLFLVSKDAE